MIRYSKILEKNPREIVLLKSRSCKWGRGFFCDYMEVSKEFSRLKVISSGSVFELPVEALKDMKDIVNEKGIDYIKFLWNNNTDFGVGEINECK